MKIYKINSNNNKIHGTNLNCKDEDRQFWVIILHLKTNYLKLLNTYKQIKMMLSYKSIMNLCFVLIQ